MGSLGGIWILLGVLFVLLLAGVRVAYVLLAVGIIGTVLVLSPSQPLAVGETIWHSMKSYSLTAIPLFILMAEILSRADITGAAYRAIAKLLGPLPGGAAYATVAGSTIFAAISGSSVANAASLGAIAAPAMVEMGFSKRLTFGAIAAGGTIGILMPPSTAMIIYASLTGVSVEQLFIAGVVPAIFLGVLFALVVLAWSLMRPGAVPLSKKATPEELISGAVHLMPIIFLIVFVLGGIYIGLFTATEAAGMGVAGAIAVAALAGKFSFRLLWEAAEATTTVTSMILLIIAGAAVVTYVVGMLGLPTAIATWIVHLDVSSTSVLILVALMYVVLGLFIEAVSLIVLTTPIVFPVLTGLGVNGVWLGVYVVILIEIALIHPPVGLNLYVLQRVPAGQSLNDIMLGALPFLVALFALLIIIIAFPQMVMWLPSTA